MQINTGIDPYLWCGPAAGIDSLFFPAQQPDDCLFGMMMPLEAQLVQGACSAVWRGSMGAAVLLLSGCRPTGLMPFYFTQP